MIRLFPKAAVMTTHHPFGGTEMFAQCPCFALNANGYDAQIININDASLQRLPKANGTYFGDFEAVARVSG